MKIAEANQDLDCHVSRQILNIEQAFTQPASVLNGSYGSWSTNSQKPKSVTTKALHARPCLSVHAKMWPRISFLLAVGFPAAQQPLDTRLAVDATHSLATPNCGATQRRLIHNRRLLKGSHEGRNIPLDVYIVFETLLEVPWDARRSKSGSKHCPHYDIPVHVLTASICGCNQCSFEIPPVFV